MPRHPFYNTAAWKRLRRAAQHDAEYLCTMCGDPLTASDPVDHDEPHRGDRALFFDPENLRALCKTCHDGPKQRAEARGHLDGTDAAGWPTDPRHPVNRRRGGTVPK